jgi:hypothetical protein
MLAAVRFSSTFRKADREKRENPRSMAYQFNNLNVLLVEDDPAMRGLIRDVLAAFHIGNVQTATDGTRAYELLRQFWIG